MTIKSHMDFDLEEPGKCEEGGIRDINGNKVGTWELVDK